MGLIMQGGYAGVAGGPPVSQAGLPGAPLAAYASSPIVPGFAGAVTALNGGIYSWIDQSGNGHTLTAESANGLTFSAQNGFTFSGSNSLRKAALQLPESTSIYIVASVQTPCKGALITNGRVGSTPNTGYSFGLGNSNHETSGGGYFTLIQTVAWGSGLPVANGKSLFRAYKKPGYTLIGLNSQPYMISSTSSPLAVTDGIFCIGGHMTGQFNRYFSGTVKSVLVYGYDTVQAGEDTAITAFCMGL